MEIKIGEILDCVEPKEENPLDNLRDQKLPFLTSLKLKDNVEIIKNQHKKILEATDELISKHTEGKQVITSKHKNWSKFISEYDDIKEAKIKLDIKPLTKGELINTFISEKDLEKLEFLINMEE